ncbi:endolytic transglycosylase MltG [Anaeromicrobium sediminis]|uniref:Aminodeoxychorismate lyase n=1 Tax=Anaeromicrobium sediminis TaxID=1478221 RepID=A0A267MNQ7_9FIRM|nr:endolytic transglycosylase MltG [Anaeromicrobium sediminis]PAB61241.1 hypothetical protein CCE28_02090 [Anaeromicrobium sediminis]
MKRKLKTTLLMGIGIGFIICSTFNIISKEFFQEEINDEYIKTKAKQMGMVDPKDHFVKKDIYNKEVKKEEPVMKKKNEKELIKVVIPKGSTSEEIGEILKSHNVIQSTKLFLRKINDKNLEEKLRWGVYEMKINASIDEIIEKIIVKK